LFFQPKTADCCLWTITAKLINERETQNNTHSKILTTIQNKLAAAFKSSATVQTAMTNASLRHQRRMVKRETSGEMAGYRNRPVSLLLSRKKMITLRMFFQPNETHKCTSSLVPFSQTSEWWYIETPLCFEGSPVFCIGLYVALLLDTSVTSPCLWRCH